MEQHIQNLLLNLGNDIQGTILMEILEVEIRSVQEPGMKIGIEPNFRVVGQMTDFEKKCFHLFFNLYWQHMLKEFDRRKAGYDDRIKSLDEEKNQYLYGISPQEKKKQKIFKIVGSLCDDGKRDLELASARSRLAAIRGLLIETIRDRLKLSPGKNVRYYLAEGFQIVSESGIMDKPVIETEPTAQEIQQALSLDAVNEKTSEPEKGGIVSKFMEEACVLF